MRDLHLLSSLLQSRGVALGHPLAGAEFADDDGERFRRRLEQSGEIGRRVVDMRLVRDVRATAGRDRMREVVVELPAPVARPLHRHDVMRHAHFIFDGADRRDRGVHRRPDLRVKRAVEVGLRLVAHAEQNVRSGSERRHQGRELGIRRRLRPTHAAQCRIVPNGEHHVHARFRSNVIDDPADVGEVIRVREHGLPLRAPGRSRIAFQIEPDEVGFPDVDQLVDTSLDLGHRGRLLRARIAAPGIVKVRSAAVPDPAVAAKDVVPRRVQPRARSRHASVARTAVGAGICRAAARHRGSIDRKATGGDQRARREHRARNTQ